MKIRRWNEKSWLTLLLLFLLVFPKGGIKVASIPLTWGYLLLGLTAIVFLLKKKWIVCRAHFFVLWAQIPFQLVSLISLGITGIGSGAFTIGFATIFFLFPALFFGLFSKSIQNLDIDFFISFLKKGVLFVSSFGIFLFFLKILTGKFLLIPLLTSNLHDIDMIDLTKNIARGGFFKLISTYNNGNLYGICILMLLPLYHTVEKSRWKQAIVKFSLILTLSRTVWIGLMVEEFVRQFYVNRLTQRTFLKFALQWMIVISVISLALHLLGYTFSFIFDTSLGGRSAEFSILSELTWFGKTPFQGIGEIVYLSVLKSFGILGLVTFLIAMTSPLWIYAFFSKTETSLFQRSLLSGLSLYLFISCSDSAISLIPVMAFYWFLSSLLLAKPASSPLTTSPKLC